MNYFILNPKEVKNVSYVKISKKRKFPSKVEYIYLNKESVNKILYGFSYYMSPPRRNYSSIPTNIITDIVASLKCFDSNNNPCTINNNLQENTYHLILETIYTDFENLKHFYIFDNGIIIKQNLNGNSLFYLALLPEFLVKEKINNKIFTSLIIPSNTLYALMQILDEPFDFMLSNTYEIDKYFGDTKYFGHCYKSKSFIKQMKRAYDYIDVNYNDLFLLIDNIGHKGCLSIENLYYSNAFITRDLINYNEYYDYIKLAQKKRTF